MNLSNSNPLKQLCHVEATDVIGTILEHHDRLSEDDESWMSDSIIDELATYIWRKCYKCD